MTILKKIMTQLVDKRTRGKQETCHLINSLPLTYSSWMCKKVNLGNESTLLELDEDNETINLTMPAVDAYVVRFDSERWANIEEFNDAIKRGMAIWNLDFFAKSFVLGRNSKKNLIKRHF